MILKMPAPAFDPRPEAGFSENWCFATRDGRAGPAVAHARGCLRLRYFSRKSRKKSFCWPGAATGLPWLSKPLFCAAACCDSADWTGFSVGPGVFEATGDTGPGGAALKVPDGGTVVLGGGGSSAPVRPQAVSPRAAATARQRPILRQSTAKERSIDGQA
jgi:hypothetical protein